MALIHHYCNVKAFTHIHLPGGGGAEVSSATAASITSSTGTGSGSITAVRENAKWIQCLNSKSTVLFSVQEDWQNKEFNFDFGLLCMLHGPQPNI